MNLSSIKRNVPLSEKSYQIIKEAIIKNELKPGDILAEEKLSAQLSISRTPSRTALQQLVFDGLAEININKNVVVTNVTETDIANISIVRCNLEILGVQLLSKNISNEDIEQLRRLITLQKNSLGSEDEQSNYLEFINSDYEFHIFLAEITHNPFLIEMIKKVNLISNRFLALSGTMNKYSELAIEEHLAIIKYLEKEQYEYAVIAIRDHIMNVQNRILKK